MFCLIKMLSETDVTLKAICGLDWMDGLEISGPGYAESTFGANNNESGALVDNVTY